ncbi:MAG: AMP-binding protein [Porticoccaceae bacterium]
MVDSLISLIAGDAIADTRPLAAAPEGIVDWGWFRRRVRHHEERLATLPPGPVAIHQPEPCEFLACLWSTWRQGRVAVLSANGFRDLAHALAEPLAGDIRTGAFDPAALPADMPADTALVLFTSGSTGAPQPVPKSLAQLDAELAMLDELWGDSLANTLVVNMVSHHHMFGLPFGLLWPLARGALFHARPVHYPEPLAALVRTHRVTLMCSPVHLQHLPDSLDAAALRGRVARVFSAGAPLPEDTAARCLALFGRTVTEIYGSTETGAVAWREESAGDWHCLPGIDIDHPPASRQLRIHSPALPERRPLVVADCGEIHSPNTFSLAGRIDRIVKVGGKRVSLTAVENALAGHPWVREARVVLLAERKGRLGAVVSLNHDGNAALVDRGRNAVNGLLKAHIAGPVEPIALPRYWRYVARLPVNGQGKITGDALTDLFISERQGRFPLLLDSEVSGDSCRLTLHIPDNLFYFNGHFPGRPVLPGVVQVHWAIHYARERFTGLDEFAGLEAVKFQQIVQPGIVVTLELQWRPDCSKLHFSYQSPRTKHASGRVLFARGTPP